MRELMLGAQKHSRNFFLGAGILCGIFIGVYFIYGPGTYLLRTILCFMILAGVVFLLNGFFRGEGTASSNGKEEYWGYIRSERHNWLNHLQVLYGMLQLEKPKKALEYMDVMVQELECSSVILKSVSPDLAFLLLNYMARAKEEDIEYEIEIDPVQDVKINSLMFSFYYELFNRLFSPLLQGVLNSIFIQIVNPEVGCFTIRTAVCKVRSDVSVFKGDFRKIKLLFASPGTEIEIKYIAGEKEELVIMLRLPKRMLTPSPG